MYETATMLATGGGDPRREAGELASATGAPRFNRRLSDKLLAAFNHAYAMGETDVAHALRDIIARIEADKADAERRGVATPLGQAELWVRFVQARNDYRLACDAAPRDPAAVEATLEEMKRAYRSWSLS